MSCANVEHPHHCNASDAARSHVPKPADEKNSGLAPWSQALAFAIEADHNSVWPTHRIRSFLLSQPWGSSSLRRH